MHKIAIIPLRAGSKGIPGKNKKKLLGRPLYQWVLGESLFSKIDHVILFTDDEEILAFVEKEYSWTSKIIAIKRSEESATDVASSELAIIEAAEKYSEDFDLIGLIQATSPLLTSEDINNGIEQIERGEVDSTLSVVEMKRFFWDDDGNCLNYDFMARPRRQDFKGQWCENGAVYFTRKQNFLSSRNRISGKIGLVKMDESSFYEIDEASDWPVVEKLLENKLRQLKQNPAKTKLMVFDVDGVFTDGKVGVSVDGELFKTFSLRDGMGFELLKESGITPVVMTSEQSEIVRSRMNKLGIEHTYLGVKDKFSRLNFLLAKMKILRNEVAYVGDDINDLANICSVSWGICPADAVPLIKNHADLVLQNRGGDMAIREAIEFIIKNNQKIK